VDLRQLRYFVGIADAGSIARAAEWLHVAQPALSVQLANLEAELGVSLVVRSNRGVELTPRGELLYEHATEMLNLHREAVLALKKDAGASLGKVSLGLPSTLAAALSPKLFETTRRQLPGVELYILEASTAALFEWLQSGKIDFAILFNMPDDLGLDVTPLYSEDFCLVGAPDGNCEDTVAFDDLFDYPLILPSKATSWRKLLDIAAGERERAFHSPIESESINVLKSVAVSGAAYAIIPRLAVHEEIQTGAACARRIINPELLGTKSLVTLQSQLLTDTQKRVRDLIVELAQARAAEAGLELRKTERDVRRVLPSSPFSYLTTRPAFQQRRSVAETPRRRFPAEK
jgi:LysR family nitrogen assimilation transcriptional regulator